MKTEIFKITNTETDKDIYSYCADIIRRGGVVCFPTETVYGIGADCFNEDACKKIFEYKKRPADKPLLCHIASSDMAEKIACLTEIEHKLLAYFTPGPLTLIAPKKDCICDTVCAKGTTVGIRFPSNIEAMSLISACGVPLAATSANISSLPAPTDPEEVIKYFDGVCDAIIDGGKVGSGTASTIISLSDGLKILREGDISEEAIRTKLKESGWNGL